LRRWKHVSRRSLRRSSLPRRPRRAPASSRPPTPHRAGRLRRLEAQAGRGAASVLLAAPAGAHDRRTNSPSSTQKRDPRGVARTSVNPLPKLLDDVVELQDRTHRAVSFPPSQAELHRGRANEDRPRRATTSASRTIAVARSGDRVSRRAACSRRRCCNNKRSGAAVRKWMTGEAPCSVSGGPTANNTLSMSSSRGRRIVDGDHRTTRRQAPRAPAGG